MAQGSQLIVAASRLRIIIGPIELMRFEAEHGTRVGIMTAQAIQPAGETPMLGSHAAWSQVDRIILGVSTEEQIRIQTVRAPFVSQAINTTVLVHDQE